MRWSIFGGTAAANNRNTSCFSCGSSFEGSEARPACLSQPAALQTCGSHIASKRRLPSVGAHSKYFCGQVDSAIAVKSFQWCSKHSWAFSMFYHWLSQRNVIFCCYSQLMKSACCFMEEGRGGSRFERGARWCQRNEHKFKIFLNHNVIGIERKCYFLFICSSVCHSTKGGTSKMNQWCICFFYLFLQLKLTRKLHSL